MKNRIARYLAYNQSRISKAVQFNPGKANLLFKVIPFLLHSNYPDLPGYVNDDCCPCGIHHFRPEQVVDSELFRRYFPKSTARYANTPDPHSDQPCIHSLKTIGSIGTIAETEISDCDYWLSIRQQEISARGMDLLERKCRSIEEWSAKRGTEIHFFLMDIEQTRKNSFESRTGEESAGSAIKVLLKDELFRTHILVAGKMLLWWLIPPGLTADEYPRYTNRLYQSSKINPDYFIDLGYLSDIPKAEIFGACLWQMNKALDSPFKSVIKFAYLELLQKNEAKTLPWFSDTIKCLVTFTEKPAAAPKSYPEVADIDPYLLLAREIAAFYRRTEAEHQRDNFIRECFYLKSLEGMQSRGKGDSHNDRLLAVKRLMKDWDLLPDNHERFTELRTWKYKELLEFGAKVHDYLVETYKRLRLISNTFGDDSAISITQRDLSVLGRKLFTFYEKKPDKIEYVRSISRRAMGQRDVTFHISHHEGVVHYYAFQGDLDAAAIKEHADSVIKRENEPVILIAWLVINGIVTRDTRLHLTKNFLPIDLVDIQQLVEVILKIFPPVYFAQISPAQLLRKEEVIQALVVVNIGKKRIRGHKHLESTLVTANSYGEYFINYFNSLVQLKNVMRLLFTQHFVSRMNNNLEIFIPDQEEKYHIKTLLS